MKGLDYTAPSPNKENKFTFNGQTEKETKLNLNWHETAFRGYDPQLGRFHQIDPLADLFTGINPYQFGYNNPVLFNDPTGLLPQDSTKKATPGPSPNEEKGMQSQQDKQKQWQELLNQNAINNFFSSLNKSVGEAYNSFMLKGHVNLANNFVDNLADNQTILFSEEDEDAIDFFVLEQMAGDSYQMMTYRFSRDAMSSAVGAAMDFLFGGDEGMGDVDSNVELASGRMFRFRFQKIVPLLGGKIRPHKITKMYSKWQVRESHHLAEQRLYKDPNLNTNRLTRNTGLAASLRYLNHREVTRRLQILLPYGQTFSRRQIVNAYIEVYTSIGQKDWAFIALRNLGIIK
jgi:RHS repeat-associated protein